jgi:hypothetical protein
MAITTNGVAGVPADGVATLSNKTLEAPIINNATFTGQQAGLQIAFGNTIIFEGTTADAFETTLTAGDPTADRTLTLPDATDTLVGKATTDNLSNKTLVGGLASGDPTVSLGLATKQYVDAVTAGINFHAPVVAASTANLASTYSNGTSGVGATLTADTSRAFGTLDGQSVSVGNRVLIKDQTDAKQNGIYTLTTAGSVSVPWVLTRAEDSDNSPAGEMANGDIVLATGGTANNGKTFVNATTGTITVGTTNITYSSYYSGLPSQSGSATFALVTDGTTPSWSTSINGTTIPASKTLVDTTSSQTLSGKTIAGTGVIFAGSSSGTATVLAPATAGTTTITLPSVTGTVATTGGATLLNGGSTVATLQSQFLSVLMGVI